MPAIRGVYYNHPETGEPGLWVLLLNGNVVGRTQAQLEQFLGVGNTTKKTANFITAATALFQAALEESTPLASLDPDVQDKLTANPPPYCRIEGNNLVAQLSIVTFEVLSVSPLRYQVTISEGASRSEVRYG